MCIFWHRHCNSRHHKTLLFFQYERYFKWRKLQVMTAYCKKFVHSVLTLLKRIMANAWTCNYSGVYSEGAALLYNISLTEGIFIALTASIRYRSSESFNLSGKNILCSCVGYSKTLNKIATHSYLSAVYPMCWFHI